MLIADAKGEGRLHMEPKKMEKDFATMECDCGCCVLVFSKTVWDDGMADYDVSVMDSYYDHKANGVWNRIRRAAKALFGKPVYFNDVTTTDRAKFAELVDRLAEMRDWEPYDAA